MTSISSHDISQTKTQLEMLKLTEQIKNVLPQVPLKTIQKELGKSIAVSFLGTTHFFMENMGFVSRTVSYFISLFWYSSVLNIVSTTQPTATQ